MRAFLAVVFLLIVGVVVGGFALGWFNVSTSPNDDRRDITLTVDPDKVKKDRDSVLGLFHSKDPKADKTPAADGRVAERAEFQKQAEAGLKAMDRSLEELKGKAKTASADARETLNQTINDLGKKVQAARTELKDLAATPQEGYETIKTRLSAAMDELKVGFANAGSRL